MDNDPMSEAAQSATAITIVGPLPGEVRGAKRDIVERSVEVADLRQKFASFLAGLQGILSADVPAVGPYELDEVQFTAEISANGDFKLMGTGVGVEASSGVTFTLKRKKPEPPGK